MNTRRTSQAAGAQGNLIVDEMWESVMAPAIHAANKNLREAKKSVPKKLLHFTDAAGLVGIFGRDLDINRRPHLRLCRARASNDPMEFQYGLDLALECLNTMSHSDGDFYKFKAEIRGGLNSEEFLGKRRDIPEPHICCLTLPRRERSVPQWAMYGRGGAGCVIVFRGPELARDWQADLVKVDYNPTRQRKTMNAILRLALDTCLKGRWEAQKRSIFSATGIDRHFRTYARVMSNIVAMQATAMKRKEFDFEDEWRLVVSYFDASPIGRQLKVGAFAAGSIIKTYYELPIKASQVESIIVGPNVSALNIRAVEIMLRYLGHGWRNIDVRKGDISLRL
jgi:hypothetical protein